MHIINYFPEGLRGQPQPQRNNMMTYSAPPSHHFPPMSTNGLPLHAAPNHHFQQKPMQTPWNGGSAGSSGTFSSQLFHKRNHATFFFSTGPPSFSSNTNQGPPPPGMMAQPGPQQPPKPILSSGSGSAPPGPTSSPPNPDFQATYNGTELVMLYDYKVC